MLVQQLQLYWGSFILISGSEGLQGLDSDDFRFNLDLCRKPWLRVFMYLLEVQGLGYFWVSCTFRLRGSGFRGFRGLGGLRFGFQIGFSVYPVGKPSRNVNPKANFKGDLGFEEFGVHAIGGNYNPINPCRLS